MSDVRGEAFEEAASVPSVVDEVLDSSVASDSGEKVASSAEVGEEQVTVTNAQIAQLLGDLDDSVRALTDRTEFYEDLVRKLQNRVESLQVDQVQQLLGPVLTRLAILVTQSADAAQLARVHGEGYRADVEFEYFHDALIETLDLIGVESVGAAPGAVFDRSVHASRKTVRTGDQGLDWTVAKVLRQGLVRPGSERAFLPAQVSVYRYDAELNSSADDPHANEESDQEGTLE